jgi:hypothetical protein
VISEGPLAPLGGKLAVAFGGVGGPVQEHTSKWSDGMSTLGKVFKVVLMVGAGTASLAPSAFSSEGFRTSEARCATCCLEEGSTCVAGGTSNPHRYYKESGPCGDTAPAPPP